MGKPPKTPASASPDRELAARPTIVTTTTAAAGVTSTQPGVPARGGGPAGTAPPATSAPAGTGGTVPGPTRSGETVDAAGDIDRKGPSYSDLTRVHLDLSATELRVVVQLRGPAPARLAAAEQVGLGVDLLRDPNAQESDYQLFVDGGPDGWFAYLDTPTGFVRYPGSFTIDGAQLTFALPASSVQGPSLRAFSAFCDWTRKGTVVSDAAEDHAPDRGRTAIRP